MMTSYDPLVKKAIHFIRQQVSPVEILFFTGLGCMYYGLYQVAPWLAWLITGLILMVLAIRYQIGGN